MTKTLSEAPATQPEDIADIDFAGENFEIADLLPGRDQAVVQWQTLWMMAGTLKDDKATLTARLVKMERDDASEVFLNSLDVLISENKRIGEILDYVHKRVMVAAAAAIVEMEGKAE